MIWTLPASRPPWLKSSASPVRCLLNEAARRSTISVFIETPRLLADCSISARSGSRIRILMSTIADMSRALAIARRPAAILPVIISKGSVAPQLGLTTYLGLVYGGLR